MNKRALFVSTGTFVFLFLLFQGVMWYINAGFNLSQHYIEHTLPSKKLPKEISLILSQPFTYINQGREISAYISEDGLWVLKIIREKRFSISPFSFFTKHKANQKKKNHER